MHVRKLGGCEYAVLDQENTLGTLLAHAGGTCVVARADGAQAHEPRRAIWDVTIARGHVTFTPPPMAGYAVEFGGLIPEDRPLGPLPYDEAKLAKPLNALNWQPAVAAEPQRTT